ncbi:MAG: U-box protein 34 isoform [Gammaproteobacteria bacterium]|jgi:hypothetical protein|nr:U-box protein 34 isoform [Gammaproteobacteria bacterium]
MPNIGFDTASEQFASVDPSVITSASTSVNSPSNQSTTRVAANPYVPAAKPSFSDAVKTRLHQFIADFEGLKQTYARRHPLCISNIRLRLNELNHKLNQADTLNTDMKLYFCIKALLQDSFSGRTTRILFGGFDTFGYFKFKHDLAVLFQSAHTDYLLRTGLTLPELTTKLMEVQTQTKQALKTAYNEAIRNIQTQHAAEKLRLETDKQKREEENQILEGEKLILENQNKTLDEQATYQAKANIDLQQIVGEYETGKRYGKLVQENKQLKNNNQALRNSHLALQKMVDAIAEEKRDGLKHLQATVNNITKRFDERLEQKLVLQKQELQQQHKLDMEQQKQAIISELKIAHKGKLRIPSRYYCSISREIMQDPVMIRGDKDQHCFEHTAIEAWLNDNSTHPITREYLYDCTLIANQGLKRDIRDFMESADVELLNNEHEADHQTYNELLHQPARVSLAPQRLFQQATTSSVSSSSVHTPNQGLML